MKKILFVLLGFSCSTLALEHNPIAPPSVEVADRFGVNMESGQLARSLKTVSIGGELGLSHNVQLYTDLFADGNYIGFVDAFAGTVTRKNISENIIDILTSGSGDTLTILAFRDKSTYEYDHTKRVSVMRAYGPAGSQDFLVYQNGVVNRDASATSGYTFKAVGDRRHSLTESADKSYLTWTTPDGIESKYASVGRRLVEVTYPNGYKVRVSYKGVTTNTGFMLKYHFNTPGMDGTPSQIVGINLANQYCSADAVTCGSSGWPTATFSWPTGTPDIFWTPGIPSSNYLLKLTTNEGVTEIQYQPENLCITNDGYEDASCSGSRTGLGKWSPRLRSIKTPQSTVPNYEYTYKNIGTVISNSPDGYFPYWYLGARVGQITNAVMNGTDTESYGGPSLNPGTSDRNSSEITAVSARYEPNVLHSVTTKKSGTYFYHQDLRKLVDRFYPIAGGGPAQQYFYDGPRGNLNQIKSIAPSTPMLLQEAGGYASTCTYPKTCNKPTWTKDARGNETTYEYDPRGRFGNPIKITAPADKNGVRASTVYKYEQKYAYYKKDGETITQDPAPIWMLTSEHTCRTTETCAEGSLDMIKTTYDYGPQNSGQPNNLLLRGKSVTAEHNGSLTTKVWCYEYDKYGNRIGETQPKANLSSCPQ